VASARISYLESAIKNPSSIKSSMLNALDPLVFEEKFSICVARESYCAVGYDPRNGP
jgi:hypothetical protein